MKKTHSIKEPALEKALFDFRIKLGDLLRREATEMKCPLSQIEALSFIAEKGKPTMKEIASHLRITPPSTTSLVEILIEKKLVTRISSENDRRTIRVSPTPNAWSFFKKLHDRKFTVFTKLLSKLSTEEKKQFVKILTILTKE
jgi:DNA-binding MarR family transcriptional regulator